MRMSDYEMLMVVLTIMTLVLAAIALGTQI